MKDKNAFLDYKYNNVTGAHASSTKVLEDEIQRLRRLISKITENMCWGNSVVKVVFRDESFVEKYRSKVENFFKEILDKDENFILNSQIYDGTEQEFIKLQKSFQAEGFKKGLQGNNSSSTSNNIPIYSSEFDGVLHCDEPEAKELDDKKLQTMTCFNCLGDHHMKQCPEKIDRVRMVANKKELLMENSSRYHEEERKNAIKPGNLSTKLREAMGLKDDQLPPYIYNMRVIGYPPGWMDDAVFETSGLSMYDSEGNDISGNDDSVSESGTKYDSSKFVNYPGFNSTVPLGFKDEWKKFGLVPLQPHHQLSETLKADNTINSSNLYKRKHPALTSDEEVKKVRNETNDVNESNAQSPEHGSSENISTPEKHENSSLNDSISSALPDRNLSLSLSKSPGTPILPQGNCYRKLPGADKFSQGITEHLPFENLPDTVGKYERMRGILSNVQKKLHTLHNDS